MGTYHVADVLDFLRDQPEASVQCVVTSPPYWGQRDYKRHGQIGLEPTVDAYVERMVEVFAEVRRVLRDDGTLWLNLGDAYNAYNGAAGPSGDMSKIQSRERPHLESGYGLCDPRFKPKDLLMLPARVAIALHADGWWLRSDIIWHKQNPMPESVTDRPTKAHEYLFLLTKSARYFWDAEAVREQDSGQDHARAVLGGQPSLAPPGQPPHRGIRSAAGRNGDGRNIRTVWTIATQPYSEAHFATFPQKLVEPCVLAGSRGGDVVLDPFMGSGTVALVAQHLGRRWLGCDLNPEYAELARGRCEEFTLAMEA